MSTTIESGGGADKAIIYFEIGKHMKVFDVVDPSTILHLDSGAVTFMAQEEEIDGTKVRRRHTIRGDYHIVYGKAWVVEEVTSQ